MNRVRVEHNETAYASEDDVLDDFCGDPFESYNQYRCIAHSRKWYENL